jgi:DNA-binding transcriptional LysR family regulator
MFVAGEREWLPVSGSVTADSADLLLDLALAGAGILRFGDFLGAAAVQDGRLVPLLTRHHDDDPQPLTALVPPGRSRLPAVRAFLDFLKELPASDVLP